MKFDFCMIGGGIVGLAAARHLLKSRPGASLLLLEKEPALARHQTGHNSGVIHAGIYYAPGSLKARLCREGAEATKAFCREHEIPFETCGKLLVATTPREQQRLGDLTERARLHGIAAEPLCRGGLREREPNISGLEALFIPSTAIVDYKAVCRAMAAEIEALGGIILCGKTVTFIRETLDGVEIRAGEESWQAGKLVACAGLQSDRIARLAGMRIEHQIIPFRGEYFQLPDTKSDIIRHLIYPIPDPALPFLGIHLTRMIDGRVTVGPNAVLGRAREGYAKTAISPRDITTFAGFPGFWKLLWRYRRSCLAELRTSISRSAYLAACRQYCPSLADDDLKPIEAGIRAQAVMRDGTLCHDFLFLDTARMLHVCNAPSPAATSAIPIGAMIGEKLLAI
jgi:L-2-hydroxyglutarate oxidase